MRKLPELSLDFFWKLMDKAWIANPEEHEPWELAVQHLSQLATVDEEAALTILDMNFLDSIEKRDPASVEFLLYLAISDRDELWRLLTSPELNALTQSGQEEVPALLYLNMKDPQSAAIIRTLPWVQDGIHGFELWSIGHLTHLSLQSQPVFHALLAKQNNWLPPDPWADVGSLGLLVSMSSIDGNATLKILDLPFLRSNDYADFGSLESLAELAQLNPSYLADLASHPLLVDGSNENIRLLISLFRLRDDSPEAAVAIESLPWVLDGISDPPSEDQTDQQAPIAYEYNTVLALLELAGRSPELMVKLLARPWMREPTDHLKWSMVTHFSALAKQDAETALQVAEMPFLSDLQEDDEASLAMINLLGRSELWRSGSYDRESLKKMFLHPGFIKLTSDPESEEISGILAMIIMEVKFPQETKVPSSYTWIEDGIDASEYPAIRGLAKYMLAYSPTRYSNRVVWVLTSRRWVEDGLTDIELAAIHSLEVLAQHQESITMNLFRMPFLESVDAIDAEALSTLSDLADQRDPDYVWDLLDHPAVEGGITDSQAAIIATSYSQLHESLENLYTLLDVQDP